MRIWFSKLNWNGAKLKLWYFLYLKKKTPQVFWIFFGSKFFELSTLFPASFEKDLNEPLYCDHSDHLWTPYMFTHFMRELAESHLTSQYFIHRWTSFLVGRLRKKFDMTWSKGNFEHFISSATLFKILVLLKVKN